jgi:site-specific DNA-methyltransferase (adenine-specific)
VVLFRACFENRESPPFGDLIYMTIRLVEMYRILKPTGSIYLHCDPTASHYLKLVMDSVFGHENFRNEIVWCYSRMAAKGQRQLSRVHDIIFWYSKGTEWIFNVDDIRLPYSAASQARAGYKKTSLGGGVPKGEICELNSKGKFPEDWIQIPFLRGKERLGYPTQKPLALLERIIKASSNENDIIFDPFCGCGTTIEAAIKNNRQWIGCDIAIHSVKLIQETRISKYSLVEGVDYVIEGVPQSAEQAQYLFEQDAFQFQHWAVEKTGGFCSNKKTGDRGIDGKIYFEVDRKLCSMVLSVKGGNIKPADIRDLRGVLEREKDVEMAGFISLQKPTKAMMQEADEAGYYEYQGVKYPRIQLLTIQEIFDGKRWYCPSVVRAKRKDLGQTYLTI